MDNTSQFQSKMSYLFPEHYDSDKIIRENIVKDIAIDLVNSNIKMEEKYLMVNSINTLTV